MFLNLYRRLLHPDTLDSGGGPAGDQPETLASSVQGTGNDTPGQKIKFRDEVAGVEREFTPEEASGHLAALFRDREKLKGADEKFRRAAEIREQAAAAIQFQETVNKAKSGDVDAFKEVAKALELDRDSPGLTDEVVKVLKGEYKIEPTGTPEAPRSEPSNTPSLDQSQLATLQRVVKFFDAFKDSPLSPEQAIALAVGNAEEASSEKAREMTRTALTRDPVIGRIISERKGSVDAILKDVFADVRSRVDGGAKLDVAIKEAREYASRILAASIPSEEEARFQAAISGMGQAPASLPSAPLQAEAPKVDPKKIGDPRYFSQTVDQMAAHLMNQED